MWIRQPGHVEAFNVLCPYEKEKRWSDFIELQEGAVDPTVINILLSWCLSEIYADEQKDYVKATDRVIAALHAHLRELTLTTGNALCWSV